MYVVVLGYIVRGPLGGLAWHHFQYVLGLKALGYEVLFLEDSEDFPSCYDASKAIVSIDPSYGLIFIKKLFNTYNLNNQWAYFDAHTNTWFGLSQVKVVSFCLRADFVLNISGTNPLREWWIKIPKRILIDTDPGFTQIKHLTEPSFGEIGRNHSHHLTFAENINKDDCHIPADGFNWKATRQPVYLPTWKVAPLAVSSSWTTVMQWDSYKARVYKNQTFGMKSKSFENYLSLPELLSDEIFELAIGNASTEVKNDLIQRGWRIRGSLIPTQTPWTYQDYIAESKGEWGVSKSGYVDSNSGWFSERSLCYMASGKPVVVQETGFSEHFQTGIGVLPFSTLEEAIENIKKVNIDYKHHCKQARKIVEEQFDHSIVLADLINKIN